MKKSGFTLIELLVVIAIIGILATVVVASLNSSREKAKKAKTQTMLKQIQTIISSAQISSNGTVLDMTGDIDSSSSCPGSTDLSSLAVTHACVADWRKAIDNISSYYDLGQLNSSDLYTDAWGSPFLLDENEGELAGNPCRFDTITSAGKDKSIGGGDDITYILTLSHC